MQDEMPADQLPAIVSALPSWLLAQTAAHAHRLVSEGLGEVGARRHHYRVLAVLDAAGPMSQAALGRRGGVHLSDLVATLNELADQGFIERQPDPADLRRNLVVLTRAGGRQLKKLARQVAKIQDELLAPLSPAEREQLTGLLSRLQSYHSTRPSRSAT